MGSAWRNAYPQRVSYVQAVFRLIGHLLVTAAVFVSFFVIAWIVWLILHGLHTIFPFPNEIFFVITRLELWLVYFDSGLCALLVFAGMWRFVKELMEVAQ